MKIGIVANQLKSDAVYLAKEIKSYLNRINIETAYCENIYNDSGEAYFLNNVNYIVVIGGDGTILSLIRKLNNKSVPVLGINLGTLGFIAETDPLEYKEALDKLVKGDFFISERNMLKGSVYKSEYNEPSVYYALNDFLICKSNSARLVSLDSYINGEFLVNYKADGVLVSTATGSTAYNLSAGGPVMHPGVEAYIITPICPHTLSERPLIVPKSEIFSIKVSKKNKALFTIDGQCNETVSEDDRIDIEVGKDKVRLVQFFKTGFYDKLKSRLFWGK